MQYKVNTPEEYIESIPEERRAPIVKLRAVINENLPSGFEECISYGMIGWVVPHSIYPAGYHCDPKLPLPFLSIASQKNFIGFYHMGIYADHQLTQWFQEEYAKVVPTKLDMGKSCVRLKKPEHIPYDLIGELCTLITPEKWIEVYEGNLKR
ncbi:MAG: DUF1801 domain-containing protein [Bacteroidetes bacterium]|nr:MAG: DUF1801 domain-containing protein [Bacteroidota bacterium]